MTDSTDPIRQRASQFPQVEEGKSCSQCSFKSRGKAFLYIGEQGGRHKAMFKLTASLTEAKLLAEQRPKDFQIGTSGWVTTRFTDDSPMPEELWNRWLDESYSTCS